MTSLESLPQAKALLLVTCRDTDDAAKVEEIISKFPQLLNEDLNGYGRTALIYAASNNSKAIVQTLLSHVGINVNIKDSKAGDTALHWASNAGHFQIVKELLARPDLDVNIQNADGYTALHRASYKGDINIVREILAHTDIDINLKDKFRRTAAAICCEYKTERILRNKPRILELLQNKASLIADKSSSKPSILKEATKAVPTVTGDTAASPSPLTSSQPLASVVPLVISSTISHSEAKIGETVKVAASSSELDDVFLDRLPPPLHANYLQLKLLLAEEELQQALNSRLAAKIVSAKTQKQRMKLAYEKVNGSIKTTSSVGQNPFESSDFDALRELTLRELERNLVESEDVDEAFINRQIALIEEVSAMTLSAATPSALSPNASTKDGSQGVRKTEESMKTDTRPFTSTFTLPLPVGKSTHVFLTHTWRKDEEGRDNHERVSRINDALKRRGIITWFDSDRMSGAIRSAMTKALYGTCCVLICITREYELKVNGEDESDNCYYEFNLAANERSLVNRRIPIVMEKRMLSPFGWQTGRLKAEVGDKLFFDLSSDEVGVFEKRCDEIVARVREIVQL